MAEENKENRGISKTTAAELEPSNEAMSESTTRMGPKLPSLTGIVLLATLTITLVSAFPTPTAAEKKSPDAGGKTTTF